MMRQPWSFAKVFYRETLSGNELGIYKMPLSRWQHLNELLIPKLIAGQCFSVEDLRKLQGCHIIHGPSGSDVVLDASLEKRLSQPREIPFDSCSVKGFQDRTTPEKQALAKIRRGTRRARKMSLEERMFSLPKIHPLLKDSFRRNLRAPNSESSRTPRSGSTPEVRPDRIHRSDALLNRNIQTLALLHGLENFTPAPLFPRSRQLQVGLRSRIGDDQCTEAVGNGW